MNEVTTKIDKGNIWKLKKERTLEQRNGKSHPKLHLEQKQAVATTEAKIHKTSQLYKMKDRPSGHRLE